MNKNPCNPLLAILLAVTASACTPRGVVSHPTFESGQYTFRDPDQAADSLRDAVEKQDQVALAKIFGPQSSDLISSGDEVADKEHLKAFAAQMDQGVDIIETSNQNPAQKNQRLAFLTVGAQHYPFPIALYRRANGWRFDTAVGKEEIIDRRIGRNEMKAIRVAHRYVQAQHEYRNLQAHEGKAPQFARRFFSTPGEHDGLYWESAQGAPASPLGAAVAAACTEGYSVKNLQTPKPFSGYHFAILTAQGAHARGGVMSYVDSKGKMSRGFALVAYPAAHGSSGVSTFLVGPDGIIYEKNLGPHTEKIAQSMTRFDPDLSWAPVR